MHSPACKNCGAQTSGNYCSNCSQKTDTHRFTLRHLSHDIIHALTHTDKGIVFLAKELLIRPGKTVLEFNAGMRKRYFNPFTFLLLTIALQIFAAKKTHIYDSFLNQMQAVVQKISETSSARVRDETNRQLEEAKQQNPKILENSKVITLLLLPLLSLITWLFFYRTGNNYAENLVFNVFLQGELYLFFIVICIIPFLLYKPTVMLTMYLYIVVSWIFSFFAYHQFYKQAWWKVILKGIIIQSIYLYIIQTAATLAVNYL